MMKIMEHKGKLSKSHSNTLLMCYEQLISFIIFLYETQIVWPIYFFKHNAIRALVKNNLYSH